MSGSGRKIRRLRDRRGPPPRAGWAIDSVLTRSGNIDVRKLYIGPKDVDPEDMMNLMSAVVAASITSAFPNLEDRHAAKAKFLDLVETRITTARERLVDTDEEPVPEDVTENVKETENASS